MPIHIICISFSILGLYVKLLGNLEVEWRKHGGRLHDQCDNTVYLVCKMATLLAGLGDGWQKDNSYNTVFVVGVAQKFINWLVCFLVASD